MRAIAVEGEEAEFQGVNSRAELAVAERALQQRLRAAAMAAGVTMTDPDTVWLSADTRLARRRHDRPQRALRARRQRGVERRASRRSATSRARASASGAIIGPFARIRPGSEVGRGRPYRQLRRAQGDPHGPRRQGQPSRLSRRFRHRRGEQHRRRHDLRELRRLRQASHRDRRRGLHRLQQLAGRAGAHRPRRQRHRRQRDHRGRAGRRRGLRPGPPGDKEGARRAASCETEGPRGGGQAGKKEK